VGADDDLLQTARFLADGMVRPDLIEIFDRFAAGDESAMAEFQPLIELVDPELVWDSTELAVPDFPDVAYGPAAVMEFFRSWLAAWADFTWETDNFEQRGDQVIYDVHITARSRKTELPLDQHVTHRMTFRDGKLVAWRLFVDRRDA
jgi:ketosteroid isomerase-like protein